MEGCAVACPLAPTVPHLLSGSCPSPRTVVSRFLQTPPREDALALPLSFGSTSTWTGDLHSRRRQHARRTRQVSAAAGSGRPAHPFPARFPDGGLKDLPARRHAPGGGSPPVPDARPPPVLSGLTTAMSFEGARNDTSRTNAPAAGVVPNEVVDRHANGFAFRRQGAATKVLLDDKMLRWATAEWMSQEFLDRMASCAISERKAPRGDSHAGWQKVAEVPHKLVQEQGARA